MAIMKHTLTTILMLVCFGAQAQTTVIGNVSPLATNLVKGGLQVDSAVKLSKFISSDTSVLLVTPTGGVIRIPKSVFATGASVDTSLFARKTLVFAQTFDSVLSHGALTSRAFQTASGGSQVFISPTLFIRAQSGSTEFYVRPTGVSFVPNNSFPALNTSFTFINPSAARAYNFRDLSGDVAVLTDIRDTASTKLTKGGDSPTDTLKYGTLTKQPITTLVAGMPRHVIDTSGNTVDRSNIKFTSATTSMRIYNDSISANTTDTIYANSYILTDLSGTGKHYVLRAQKRGSPNRFTVDTGAIVQATNIYDTVGGVNKTPVLISASGLNNRFNALTSNNNSLSISSTLGAYNAILNLAKSDTFTALQSVQLNGQASAMTTGYLLLNQTASALAAPQNSPYFEQVGSSYNTTSSTSGIMGFKFGLSATSATGFAATWQLLAMVNGGAYSSVFSVNNAGAGIFSGGVTAASYTSAGGATLGNLSSITHTGSTAVPSLAITRTGVAGSLLKLNNGATVVDSVYNDGSIYSAGTINIAGTGTSKINGPLNYTTPTTSVFTDSAMVIEAGVIKAQRGRQSSLTATGNTTQSIPAGSWVRMIAIKCVANETIKIGTTNGGTEISPLLAYTAGTYGYVTVSIPYFEIATTLFIQGAAGSVTYQFLY